MIGGFHDNDVCHEVWAQQQAQGLDLVGLLGLSTGDAELRELLVWAQHHQLRTKHHPSGTQTIHVTILQ